MSEAKKPLKTPTREEAKEAIRTLIRYFGDNPDRPGMIETAERYVKAYEHMLAGIKLNPTDELRKIFEDIEYVGGMVMVKDINFISFCEHHTMPFFGTAHVAYIPSEGKVTGLSKLARVVDAAANKYTSQEKIATDLIKAFNEALQPKGVAVMIQANHTCMSMRGVEKTHASTITTLFNGEFETNPARQAEFLLAAYNAPVMGLPGPKR